MRAHGWRNTRLRTYFGEPEKGEGETSFARIDFSDSTSFFALLCELRLCDTINGSGNLYELYEEVNPHTCKYQS